MSPLWQKVYDANYHKSLDHRSFYFKQTDKRLLGAKGMIGDIRGACPCHLLISACDVQDDYDNLTSTG
jgi:histone deacetylase complex regulatory component SIN3